MAEEKRVAVAEITVRDRTKAGVNSAVANFQTLHSVVRDNWWGIQNLGNAFASVGTLITGGMAVAVRASADFEAGIAGVARTTRRADESAADAIKNTQGLAQELRDLAKAAPVAVSRLTAIAEEAGALGIAREDISAFTATIVKLAATTNLTDAAATKLARISGVMGIGADEVENLGSAILYMGRSTASTESEIVHFAEYLAPVIKTAHGTTAELIALSSVLPSLGARAEASRTAVQKTIKDIGDAFRKGGDDAVLFGKLMGKSADEAANITEKDGVQGLLLFVEGLHKAAVGGQNLDNILAHAGITEARQAAVLKALAQGIDSTVNSNLDLRNAIKSTTEAYQENKELTDAYNAVNSTAQAQMEILRNKVHDLGISFGNVLLPVLKLVVEGLQYVVDGFDGLPGPLKSAYALLIVAVGGFTTLIGVIALIGPKLILVKGAMLEVAAAYKTFAGSAANSAAILATANASTEKGALRTAFAYGRMSAAEREAAYAAFLQANAQKVANAIQEQAIILNEDMAYASYLVKHAEEMETLAKTENMKATQLLNEYEAALAAGKTRTAKAILVKAEAQQAEAAAALQELAATNAESAALAKQIQARKANIGVIIAETEVQLANAAATRASTTAMALFGRASALLKRSLGPILILLTLLGPLLLAHGSALQQDKEAAAENAKYQELVTKALEAQKNGQKGAIRALVLSQLGQINAAETAKKYGITLAQLNQIIMGTASASLVAAVYAKLTDAYKNGDESAGDLINTVGRLRESFGSSGAAASGAAGGVDSATNAMNDNASAAEADRKALDKLREANEQINQALLALPQALLAQREALLATKDAQDEYADALENLANHNQRVLDAENELIKARIDLSQANDDVKQAEVDLSRARQRAADDVADALDKYLDSQDKVLEADQKVKDAEAALDKLRSGPTLEEVTKATNKLTEANLKLRGSQFKVRDAQYMLNYLMAEGASARDLEEAQYNLDSANLDLAQSTQDVADAQKELTDITTTTPEELAAAERDLEKARRDAEAAVRDERDAEQDLADARTAQANDTAYKEAQEALAEALLAVSEATSNLKDAQDNLKDQQSDTSATDDLAQAQLNLEEALYRQAEANVEVQKQMALARGEEFGTGKQAKALAAELAKLGLTAGGTIKRDFDKFSGILSGARKDIKKTDDALSDFGAGFNLDDVTDAMGAFGKGDGWQDVPKEASKGFLDRMVDYFKENGVVAIATALIAIVVGAILFFVVGVPALVAVAAGALIFGLVYYIHEHADDIKNAFFKAWDWIKGAGSWIWEQIKNIWNWLKDKLTSFGGWIGNGIVSAVKSTLGAIGSAGSWIWDHLVAAWNWVKGKTSDFGEWIGNGIKGGVVGVLSFFGSLGSWIWNKFGDIKDYLGDKLKSFGGWIKDRIIDGLDALNGAVRGVMSTAFSGLKALLVVPINGVISLINSVLDKIGNIGFKYHVPGIGDIGIDLGFIKKLKIDPIKLAEGGIVTKATLGIFGEAGSEAVLPLTQLYEMLAPLNDIANQLLAMNDVLLGGAGGGVVNNQGDTFNIYANDQDPLDIAEEVVWKKLVRV